MDNGCFRKLFLIIIMSFFIDMLLFVTPAILKVINDIVYNNGIWISEIDYLTIIKKRLWIEFVWRYYWFFLDGIKLFTNRTIHKIPNLSDIMRMIISLIMLFYLVGL